MNIKDFIITHHTTKVMQSPRQLGNPVNKAFQYTFMLYTWRITYICESLKRSKNKRMTSFLSLAVITSVGTPTLLSITITTLLSWVTPSLVMRGSIALCIALVIATISCLLVALVICVNSLLLLCGSCCAIDRTGTGLLLAPSLLPPRLNSAIQTIR